MLRLQYRQLAFLSLVLFTFVNINGCAKTSPKFERPLVLQQGEMNGNEIFSHTFDAHGGQHINALSDVNVAIDGDWHYLITKIQPLVTDHLYRQTSEERIIVTPRVYAASFKGEAGIKRVLRTQSSISVSYNTEEEVDRNKVSAAALTSDAFWMFTLGPLALHNWVETWTRIEDAQYDGQQFWRINGVLQPGIGHSEKDYITLWVDPDTLLTARLHITLDGFESTKGAHVDTRYEAYHKFGPYTLPVHFFERVVGPVNIDAHEWWYTGIDINRGLVLEDLNLNDWSPKAAKPAKPIKE